MDNKKRKASQFELLKIVAMLMIVSHHLVTKNAFNVDTDMVGLDPSRVFLQLIGNHAFVGNNLFFMVSAWFLSTHVETFNLHTTIKRVWNIDKVMLFYSIGIPVASALLLGGGRILNVSMIAPISCGIWWYPTSYAIFLIFFPFLQQGLNALNEKEVRNLALVMFTIWTLPTIIPIKLQLAAGNTTCFFMLYVVIYYIRRFTPMWADNPKVYKSLCLGGYALAFLSILILDVVGLKVKSISDYACYYIRGDWRLMPVIISLGLFLWCTHWKMGYNKVINWMGGLTFAAYLIHFHPLMIDFLFVETFPLTEFIGKPLLPVYTIGVTIVIYIGCILIDQIRKWIYGGLEYCYELIRKNG